MTTYQKLEARFRQVSNLNQIASVASWDEAVMMPPGASVTRNKAMAELAVTIQKLLTDSEVGQWLNETSESSLNSWQKANLRLMKRHYLHETAVPADLKQRLVMARMNCEQKWRKLRQENNWSAFFPALQEVLNLTRESLQGLAKVTNKPIYDAALALYSPGLTTDAVEKLFKELRAELPDLINSVIDKQKSETVIQPEGTFPMGAQKALGLELMQAVGFSLDIGRLDESHHPFCGGSPRDVRITTRYREDEFISSLMGILHETGHALYEQNLPDDWLDQPVGEACGMAVHESQSLFMEMQVCRSREFFEFALPIIQKHIKPHVLNSEALTAENLYRLVTRVEKSFIRVDADEVTYPAHVILRYEIERDLLEDKWPLKELPAVWNQKMQELLGLSTLGNDRDGCMQDTHWPGGAFGYFPAYTFGAVIAAQLFQQMEKTIPQARQNIRKGEFEVVRKWLKDNIWSQGAQLGTLELVKKVSGELSSTHFLNHLRNRYLKN